MTTYQVFGDAHSIEFWGRPLVGIDIDGVAANTIEAGGDIAYGLTGRRYHHDSVVTRAMEESWGIHGDLRRLFYDAWRQPGFVRGMKPYENAVEGAALLNAFCNLFAVTAPFPDAPFWNVERDAWLEEHLKIPYKNVIRTDAKHVQDLDVLIEDKTANLNAWLTQRHERGDQPVLAIRIRRNYNEREVLSVHKHQLAIDCKDLVAAATAIRSFHRG